DSMQELSYTWNNEKYVLLINKSSGMCRLTYPSRVREFYKDNLYFENPELSLLYGGNLNESLRRQLQKIGVSIPDTPFELGFKVTPKSDYVVSIARFTLHTVLLLTEQVF